MPCWQSIAVTCSELTNISCEGEKTVPWGQQIKRHGTVIWFRIWTYTVAQTVKIASNWNVPLATLAHAATPHKVWQEIVLQFEITQNKQSFSEHFPAFVHCELDLEGSNPIFLHNMTSSDDNAPSYKVWIQMPRLFWLFKNNNLKTHERLKRTLPGCMQIWGVSPFVKWQNMFS